MTLGELRDNLRSSLGRGLGWPVERVFAIADILYPILIGAMRDERRRCIKAICSSCRDGIGPLDRTTGNHAIGGPGNFERCRAAAIRQLPPVGASSSSSLNPAGGRGDQDDVGPGQDL